MTNDQKEKIQKMREEGLSYLQIAAKLNLQKDTIKSYCRRFNINQDNTIEIYSTCKNCGEPLVQEKTGQHKKFCSEKCRRIWWKNNEKELNRKAYYSITCSGCGRVFKSYGNKNRKFCSHACYINYRFKKVRDAYDA